MAEDQHWPQGGLPHGEHPFDYGYSNDAPSRRIVVLHRNYGCETGCCGHAIKVDGEEISFDFTHPRWREDFREFAERLIASTLGTEHIADLDWENCLVIDD